MTTPPTPIRTPSVLQFVQRMRAEPVGDHPNHWRFEAYDHTFHVMFQLSATSERNNIRRNPMLLDWSLSATPNSTDAYPSAFVPLSDTWANPISCVRCPRVCLYHENPLTRFARRFKLDHKTETGDHVFDAEVFVESEAPQETVVFPIIQHTQVRSAVLHVLRSGAMRVDLFNPHAPLHISWPSQNVDDALALITDENLQRCTQITEQLPPIRVHEPNASPNPIQTAMYSVTMPVSGFSVFILFLIWFFAHPFHLVPLKIGIVVGVPMWAAGLALLLHATRNVSGRTPMVTYYIWAGLLGTVCSVTCVAYAFYLPTRFGLI